MTLDAERKEGLDLIPQLARKGILALYGGGSETPNNLRAKGHGYWLYQASHEEIETYNAANGYCPIPGENIQNDGIKSGNPHFTMFEDAEKLAEQSEDGWICPECRQTRPDDERVEAGMKCRFCAY